MHVSVTSRSKLSHIVLFYVLFIVLLFHVLFLCECVLYYCHRLSTQLQLTNISYHIVSYHIISYHIISYHNISYHISYHIISYHTTHHIISCRPNYIHSKPVTVTVCEHTLGRNWVSPKGKESWFSIRLILFQELQCVLPPTNAVKVTDINKIVSMF
jgi:hypothetical protein